MATYMGSTLILERDFIHYADQFNVDTWERDWVLIKEFPVSSLKNAADQKSAEAWWSANNDGWELDDIISDPILLVGYGNDGDVIWDGELEAVAYSLNGRETIEAVVGVEKGCDLSKLPEFVRAAVLSSGAGAPTP